MMFKSYIHITFLRMFQAFIWTLCFLLFLVVPQSYAQYSTLLTEDFDACAEGILPICGWNETGNGSPWTTTNNSCAITGLYSLAIGSDAAYCEYNRDFTMSNRIAYMGFSSLGYQMLNISFNWTGIGEPGIDYGMVVYSTDGVTWTNVSGTQYQGQPAIQAVSNLTIPNPIDNDPTVYIGFRWIDNDNTGNFPGFTVDDIVIQGEQMEPNIPPAPTSNSPGCDSVIITRSGPPPSPSNVVWYWQGTTCGTSTTVSGATYIAYTSGTYYIRAYNTVSGQWSTDCDSITVTVVPPPVANSGPGGDECDLDFTFSAVLSTGTGTWTQQSGPGTSIFSDPNDPNATVIVASYGSYIFLWTEVFGGCSDINSVIVNFYEQPVADAGSGGSECDTTFTFNAVPSMGTGTWTQQSGTGTSAFSDPNNPSATVTVSAYGTYVFLWTEVNAGCSNGASVTVNFYEQPTANAGSGGDECDLNFLFNAVSNIGVGTWTMQFGPSIASYSPNDASPTATVTVSAYGAYLFRWTEVNGICSDYSEITVNFYEQPVADAGSGGDECDTTFTFNATPSAGIGGWTQLSGPGTTTFSNVNSPSAIATVSDYGTYVFRWSEGNGPCLSFDDVTVSFYQQPVADAGIGGDECDLDFVFTAKPGVGIGFWTQQFGPDISTFSNPAAPNGTVTITASGMYVFRWTVINGPCSDYEDIYVNFYTPPVANAGDDTTISLGYSIPLNGQGGINYSWSPDLGLDYPDIANPIATPLETTTYTLTITDINGCVDSAEITISVVVDYNFIISNLMTPNGDGYNDTWNIDFIELYPFCDVMIYNRYGNLLFNTAGYINDWDGTYNGTNLPDGTYYYVIKCPGSEIIFKGVITILRGN
ncbi:MAG: gliding motility-associated C-terminal domain-containing protein [Bacteroidota bacterium]